MTINIIFSSNTSIVITLSRCLRFCKACLSQPHLWSFCSLVLTRNRREREGFHLISQFLIINFHIKTNFCIQSVKYLHYGFKTGIFYTVFNLRYLGFLNAYQLT